MATELSPSVVTIGGKGQSLNSTSLFSIATNLSQVTIDSSSLDKLSPDDKPLPSSSLPQISNPNPNFLSQEESRSSLVVLLSKLLSSRTKVRPLLPLLISETLNNSLDTSSIDFSSTLGFLVTLLRLNGKTIEEAGVTEGELVVLENSFFQWNGIGGLLDYCSSALLTGADAVAALSCEAGKADFNGVLSFMDSGDGLSVKDVAAVASDMKVLLNSSKLVGKVESGYVTEIPKVHGSLREVARLVHSKTRVELNSSVKTGKLVTGDSSGFWDALETTFSPLGSSISSLGKSSLGRARFVIDSIEDIEFRSQVMEIFQANLASFEELKKRYRRAVSDSDYLNFLHEMYSLLVKVRNVLAWEGALALFVLERNESGEKGKVTAVASASIKVNGGNPNVERKNEKKKKKVVLGKGTVVIAQLLKDRLQNESGELVENLEILNKWTVGLSLFFDPKDTGLYEFAKKVKEITETNESRGPKIPKGTRDFAKEEMVVREKAFSTIQQVFKKHGATALDTPVFELRETLMGKYGEDSKLVYDLADQGGELCSLRYDLTVPLARYVAMNGLTSFKRYQIAKVYRRDNPSKGRYREFYQCDFDIAGQYEMMGPDFDVIKILTELLDTLSIGDYEVKLNHRKLLDGMLEICGVPSEKFRTICSSIDKLDKQSFEQIKKEMVEEKGLTVDTADKIGNLVKKRGHPLQVLSELKQDGSPFLTNKGSILALNELEILFKALEKSKCIHRVVFDLSLARGLDYYTGVIFEAVFKGATQVGSIAAGGRYDNLIGMFGSKQVPAVGVSLGIERVLTIMNEQLQKDPNQAIRVTETEVLVGILGDDLSQAAALASELWAANIKTEFMVHKKIMKLIDRAIGSRIPWMVIEGEKELKGGVIKLRNIEAKEEIEIPRSRLVEELQKRLTSTS